MNKNFFYISIFLVFVLLLSGCSSVAPTPISEENLVKGVVYEYFLALSNNNWNKAKSYCVYGSDAYYGVEQMKNLFDTAHGMCSTVKFTFTTSISDVSINGNYAQVDATINMLITGCGDYASDSKYGTIDLQKIGNSWKIY